jgi:type 1 glutamine amidotransferase
MKIAFRFTLLLCGLLAASLPCRAGDAPAPAAKKKVLFFTKSSGFQHEAVMEKMPDGRPGYAFAIMKQIGEKNDIEFTFSKDGSLFTPDYLAQFDAFVFYTTQDLTKAKTEERGDGTPPMTQAGKDAFLKAIADGKGFVGLHSAADTFHSPGNVEYGPARHQNDGDKVDPYIKMLGGEFIKHDAQQNGRLTIADNRFPGTNAIPNDFGLFEEWYSLKNFAPDLHVILVQNTSRMEGPSYERPNYPSTWARMEGKGRVFYTNLGHREDVWQHPGFQAILEGGLNWALGKIESDIAPNLEKATPQANVLPKYVPVTPAPPAPAKK